MAGRLGKAAIAALRLALLWTTGAAAHPLGNFSINHQTRVEISRDRIDLLYILDQAEIPTFQERRLSSARDAGPQAAGGAREPAADRGRQARVATRRRGAAHLVPARARAACRRRASSCRSPIADVRGGRGARPHVPRPRRLGRRRRRAGAWHRRAHVGLHSRPHQLPAHATAASPCRTSTDQRVGRFAVRPGTGHAAGTARASEPPPQRRAPAARRCRPQRARTASRACSRTPAGGQGLVRADAARGLRLGGAARALTRARQGDGGRLPRRHARPRRATRSRSGAS